jgi:hypothetical protein
VVISQADRFSPRHAGDEDLSPCPHDADRALLNPASIPAASADTVATKDGDRMRSDGKPLASLLAPFTQSRSASPSLPAFSSPARNNLHHRLIDEDDADYGQEQEEDEDLGGKTMSASSSQHLSTSFSDNRAEAGDALEESSRSSPKRTPSSPTKSWRRSRNPSPERPPSIRFSPAVVSRSASGKLPDGLVQPQSTPGVPPFSSIGKLELFRLDSQSKDIGDCDAISLRDLDTITLESKPGSRPMSPTYNLRRAGTPGLPDHPPAHRGASSEPVAGPLSFRRRFAAASSRISEKFKNSKAWSPHFIILATYVVQKLFIY